MSFTTSSAKRFAFSLDWFSIAQMFQFKTDTLILRWNATHWKLWLYRSENPSTQRNLSISERNDSNKQTKKTLSQLDSKVTAETIKLLGRNIIQVNVYSALWLQHSNSCSPLTSATLCSHWEDNHEIIKKAWPVLCFRILSINSCFILSNRSLSIITVI